MLKRVSIQNFKSLKNVALALQPVNLLIGPNNSGKTNFLKALENSVVASLGNSRVDLFQELTFKHEPVDIIFEFSYIPDLSGYMNKKYNNLSNVIYHYNTTHSVLSDDNHSSVKHEINDWFSNESDQAIDIEIKGGHRQEFFSYKLTTIYRPDPSRLVQQVKLSADESRLLPDCSNLLSFLYYVDTNFRNTNARQLKDDFSKCVPEISYFTLPPVKIGDESLLGLRFFDKDDNGYWANEVSEGVLFFLMLLGIINQPDPPRLLLLEEPERGIHPRRIREVMDFIFRLAEERNVQIILTTHNEHVLDEFATRPEAVFVFDKDEEGATYVQNLQHDIIAPLNHRNRELGLDDVDLTSNLSENWLYGLLGGVPTIP